MMSREDFIRTLAQIGNGMVLLDCVIRKFGHMNL